jgi:AcrR family transcriptional regulator
VAEARQTRAERKADTRARLLVAAKEVFARRGYQGASVDEIAAEAGFSTGAIYSNFAGKEELFLALAEEQIHARSREVAAAVASLTSVSDRAHEGAREWIGFVEREPHTVLLMMEFWAFALRDPEVKPEVAARFADMRGELTRLIADGTRDFGLELTLPAEHLAIAVDALAEGIARQRLADPEAVPRELLGDVLNLLIAAAVRPATS